MRKLRHRNGRWEEHGFGPGAVLVLVAIGLSVAIGLLVGMIN